MKLKLTHGGGGDKVVKRINHKFKETDDPSLNQFFMTLMLFQDLSPNLLKARTMKEYIQWFERLYKVDRRSLLMFIYKHRNHLNGDYVSYSENVFGRKINE